LIALGRLLLDSGYHFTTITPESHARVNSRPQNVEGTTLRDIFGWSRPFAPAAIPTEMHSLLERAGALSQEGDLLKSLVRFSTSGRLLFVHSAFPTREGGAVFFGPDTYRYLALLRRLAPAAERVVDVGCGSGAGGLCLAGTASRIVLTDINPIALRYARVNAEINGVVNVEYVECDLLEGVAGPVDLVVSNPPYLIDEWSRLYRDGGGEFGEGLSVRIVRESIKKLTSGGRLILYTASAFVDGHDTFREAIEPLVEGKVTSVSYEEIDPDVFGEELERPAYAGVERLAVVSLDLRVR